MNALFESLTGYRLLHPALLALGLLVPLALLLRWRRGSPAIAFAPAAFLRTAQPFAASGVDGKHALLPRSWRVRLRGLPTVLHVIGLFVALIALARPVERTRLPFESEGIDIVLCLDVSSSMAARDLDPERTRLDVAKAAARLFVQGRPNDRIGLVTFARYPDLRCPPTLDHAAFGRILTDLDMVGSDSQEDATGIGAALARAAQVLSNGRAASRVAVLLTDGEENVATVQTPDEIAPLHAGQLCRELGVRAYAIAAGVGERAADGTLQAIDTTALERAATISGGRFFAARDASAVAEVYGEIDRLERAALAEPRYRVEERFLPFLATALGLVVLARALRHLFFATLP